MNRTLSEVLAMWGICPENCDVWEGEIKTTSLEAREFKIHGVAFRSPDERKRKPKALAPERVIFNPPATIVIWKDGTKTVVKAQDDRYDRMTGVALCYMKKALGNTSRALNDALKAAREEDK